MRRAPDSPHRGGGTKPRVAQPPLILGVDHGRISAREWRKTRERIGRHRANTTAGGEGRGGGGVRGDFYQLLQMNNRKREARSEKREASQLPPPTCCCS
jgi:hypothetical protein